MDKFIFDFLFGFSEKYIGQEYIFIFLANGFSIILLFLGVIYVFFHKEGKFSPVLGYRNFSIKIREVVLFCLIGFVSFILGTLLKLVFLVPRPYESLQIIPLFYNGFMNSFPSGHATVFSALAFTLLFFHRSFFAFFFFILVILMLLSRIISGVHYPSDIALGILVGFFVSFILYISFKINMSRSSQDQKSK